MGIFRRPFEILALTLLLGNPSLMADLPAEIMPEAPRSALMDVAMAGDRLVAVGERGHILLSDDYGRSWRQADTPSRSTLTGVSFASPTKGWAVGHDNQVLVTRDGGESWQRQYLPIDPQNHMLDVYFTDERNGLVVGAYGMAFRTVDGGKKWTETAVSDEEMHVNRVTVGPSGHLYLALEGGALLESGDGGETWDEMDSPYDGSLFGVLALNANTLLTYGLRGHVFRSSDSGVTWEAATGTAPVLLIDGIRTAAGQLVLAGQNGEFVVSRDSGRTFALWKVPVMGASAIIELPDGLLLATGLNGAWRLDPSEANRPQRP